MRRAYVIASACAIAGVFVLLGIIVSWSIAEPETVRVDVVMVDERFVPDHLIFEHGVRYQLHLENHGKETHEFTAPAFFAVADIENPEVLNRERTEIVMQPGDSKDVFLTIRRPGAYDLRCADHDWNGMVGGITVK